MPCSVRYLPTSGLVEVVYEGVISPAELQDSMEGALTLIQQHGAHICLADCSGMAGGHSVTDLYGQINAIDRRGLVRFREAIVMPIVPATQELVRFYETAAFNRGFNVRIFPDRAAALAWLGVSAD